MTNPTTLPSRRTRLIGVLLILAVGAAAALALIATELASAQQQQAARRDQVASQYDPPVLSGVAHSDGAHLSWTFDVSESTPPGWQLNGFELHRWIADNAMSVVTLSSSIATTARTYHDELSDATEEQLYAGFQFSYSVNAVYRPLAGGSFQDGKDSNTLVFTVPNLPTVSHLRISVNTLYIEGPEVFNVLRWDLPHLSWDTSTGFNQIDQIDITTASDSWELAGTTEEHRVRSQVESYEGECAVTFTLRLRYGIFYRSGGSIDGTVCDTTPSPSGGSRKGN